jgi:hypothetical protein
VSPAADRERLPNPLALEVLDAVAPQRLHQGTLVDQGI